MASGQLRLAMREALDRAGRHYPEYLAEPIRSAEGLPAVGAALEEAHYSATYQGFLAQDAVTVDGFRGDAERLLVDAIEPFETSI